MNAVDVNLAQRRPDAMMDAPLEFFTITPHPDPEIQAAAEAFAEEVVASLSEQPPG